MLVKQRIRVEVRCRSCGSRIAWIDVDPDNANGLFSLDMRRRGWKGSLPPIHQSEAPDGHLTYRFSCKCGAAPEIRDDRLSECLGIERLVEPGTYRVYVG